MIIMVIMIFPWIIKRMKTMMNMVIIIIPNVSNYDEDHDEYGPHDNSKNQDEDQDHNQC